MKKCCWVLKPAKKGEAAIYCNSPTSYKMVKDDDGLKYRKYNSFCDEHQKKWDKQFNKDWEEMFK